MLDCASNEILLGVIRAFFMFLGVALIILLGVVLHKFVFMKLLCRKRYIKTVATISRAEDVDWSEAPNGADPAGCQKIVFEYTVDNQIYEHEEVRYSGTSSSYRKDGTVITTRITTRKVGETFEIYVNTASPKEYSISKPYASMRVVSIAASVIICILMQWRIWGFVSMLLKGLCG